MLKAQLHCEIEFQEHQLCEQQARKAWARAKARARKLEKADAIDGWMILEYLWLLSLSQTQVLLSSELTADRLGPCMLKFLISFSVGLADF